MEKLIETDNSYLYLYEYEVEGKLLVNHPIKVFGKPAIQHRSIGFFSDTSIGYKYSGQLAKSIPLTDSLKHY